MEDLKKMMGSVDGTSPNMPIELVGKTLKQLRELGASEMGEIKMGSSARYSGMNSSYEMTPEAE